MEEFVLALRALGFKAASEITDYFGDEEVEVRPDCARRLGYNNGLFVVYDDGGVAWFAVWSSGLDEEVKKLGREFRLKGPTYVPRSNDGGRFCRALVASVSAPS